MYAEDLRNPENPKEDGCLVLGRWVQDKETQKYDVSLEYTVYPGDDAVFTEFELNFGGKIQLKKTEKLRKLRLETDMQYDLTCWVHSHPGLGVFFSNSDDNVHKQLSNPLRPHFLLAFVEDILTPNQEMGIFTYRTDATINAKSDLTKQYSLEVLYKWAVSSERKAFKADDYYNSLMNAKSRINGCSNIYLSNGAVIDMALLSAEQHNGFVGVVHGFARQSDDKADFVVATVSSKETIPDNEPIGLFVIASHCSIPSIRKFRVDLHYD